MLVVTLIAVTIFVGRLVDLQVVRGGTLAAEGLDQRLRTVELLAPRGSITDINGVPLAVSMDSVNVTVDQTLVTDPAVTAAALAPELGISVTELQASLTGDRRFAYVAKDITPDSWRRIDALSLPGIYPEKTTTRSYPVGGVVGNVVGFVGSEGKGIEGLEYSLDDVLAGVNGTSTFGRRSPTARGAPRMRWQVRMYVSLSMATFSTSRSVSSLMRLPRLARRVAPSWS
jgi:cell division protein FtsI (penicillin-binding protein 3)